MLSDSLPCSLYKQKSGLSRYRSPHRPIGSWGFASAVVMPGAQSGHQPKRALQGRAAVCRACGVSGAQTREDTNECATDTPHTRSRQQAGVRCALGHHVGVEPPSVARDLRNYRHSDNDNSCRKAATAPGERFPQGKRDTGQRRG